MRHCLSTNCRTKRRAFGAFAKGERHIVANSDKERKQAVKLIHGVSVKDVSGVFCEYALDGDGVRLTLSAQDYKSFFVQAVGLLKEPLFFFLECPGGSGGDADDYSVYYLDNCTLPVVRAILKRYGGILYSDGVIRFGFGSLSSDEEIYIREYQSLRIYTKQPARYEELLKRMGYQRNDSALSLWDVLSETNVGECESVECDDEGYQDIIDNLSELGMYEAKTK